MPHLISNLYEKNYTPFTAKLAPRNLWNRPVLGRKQQKVTRFGADPRWKSFWRFIRTWVTHNHKIYYTYIILCSIGAYNFWYAVLIGYYQNRNHHRSLDVAIQAEKEWDLIKPKDDDDDDEEEEDE